GFPSGHATAVGAFAVAVVYVAGRSTLPRALRLAIRSAAVAAGLVVGLARVLVGAHWPGDVVVGLALGAACAAAGAWWDAAPPPARGRRHPPGPRRPPRRRARRAGGPRAGPRGPPPCSACPLPRPPSPCCPGPPRPPPPVPTGSA